MGKQKLERMKKIMGILLAVFFVISMTAAAVTAAQEDQSHKPKGIAGHEVREIKHAMHGHEHDHDFGHGHWVWVWDHGHWMWFHGHWIWVWDHGHWKWVWNKYPHMR